MDVTGIANSVVEMRCGQRTGEERRGMNDLVGARQ